MPSVLFFAATRLQLNYFKQISDTQADYETAWYKAMPNPTSLSKSHPNLSEFSKQDLVKRENTRGKPYPRVINVLFQFITNVKARWLYNQYVQFLTKDTPEKAVIWNGLKFRQQIFCAAASELGLELSFMENGLVSEHTTWDAKGVNFGNSLPRQASFYRDYSSTLDRNASQATEKVSAQTTSASAATIKKTIFIPLQVNGDSQIICYSHWIKNMNHLADELIKIQPIAEEEGYQLVVKPHPKCPTPRKHLEEKLERSGINVVTEIDSKTLVNDADVVITINSTVGLEALEAGKKVLVLGQAFYNIEGLTLSINRSEELAQAIKTVKDWHPDAKAVQGLFVYLRNVYQVTGSWRDCTENHKTDLIQRINALGA